MTLENGTLVLVDYTASLAETGQLIETTRENDAAELDDDDPYAVYKPKLVSINNAAYPVHRGFNNALAKAAAGEPQSVVVEPAEAFGEWDRSKVKVITIRKLGDDSEKAIPGETLVVDGKPGVVRFAASGRVKMDFNHKYAGKQIRYDFDIIKVLSEPADIISEILLNTEFISDPQEYTLVGNELEVNIAKKAIRMDGIQRKKFAIQMELFEFVPELEQILFIETYRNTKALPS